MFTFAISSTDEFLLYCAIARCVLDGSQVVQVQRSVWHADGSPLL